MAKRRRRIQRRSVPRDTAPSPASAGGTPRSALPVLVAIGVVVVAGILVLLGGTPGSGAPSSSITGGVILGTPLASRTQTDAAPSAPTPAASSTGVRMISGVACDPEEQVTYHVHAHLNIRFAGELQPIPGDVGALPTCLFWLHTHAAHGVIHVEAPTETAFTLGQFFDVWGQTLSETQVLGRTVGSGDSMFIFIDRKQYLGDPRGIILDDLVAIEIQVGAKPLEPLPYTFPADL